MDGRVRYWLGEGWVRPARTRSRTGHGWRPDVRRRAEREAGVSAGNEGVRRKTVRSKWAARIVTTGFADGGVEAGNSTAPGILLQYNQYE